MSYSTKQASELVGLTPSALRYYDKEGLLPNLKRTAAGVRVFSDEDIQWIGLICCLKSSGMPIEEIKHFMQLCLQGEKTCEERRAALEKHRERILHQMDFLKDCLGTVNYKIDHYREIGIFHIDA